MTAPVRTIAAKFTAEGSETVERAIARVTAASTTASERAARAAAQAATRTIEAQRITAASYERSLRAAERAAYAEESMRQRVAQRATSRVGMTARSMAVSLDQIAVAGDASGAVLRRVATDAANFALMFSTKGPILAAIGIAGLAVFNFFAKAREERQRLEDESIAGLKRMQDAGDLTGMKQRLMDIDRGTPGEGFKDSLAARQKAIDDLRNAPNPFLNPVKAAAFELARLNGIKEEEAAVRALKEEYDRLAAAIMNFQRPNALPTTTPIVTRAKGGRIFPEFRGAPHTPRESVDMSALEARVDERLAGTFRPLGDPKKFIQQLNTDLAETFAQIKIPPMPAMIQWQQDFADTVAGAMVAGFAGGIEQAIASGSIGDGFKALGAILLAGLGSAMIDFGKAALVASTLMAKVKAALATLNPWMGAAAAVALIAAGSVLRGVATRAFGGMGGGGGGVGGVGGMSFAGAAAGGTMDMSTRLVFGNNSVSTAAGMTPRQANNITIIGPDDPRAQRAITELLNNASGRGLSTGTDRSKRGG